MKISKLDIGDQVELKKLHTFIDKVFWENSDLKSWINSSVSAKLHKDIYSVQNENEIIAVASTHKSTWHPNCIYVQLAYDLNGVDKQVLQVLIDELENNYDQPLFFLLDDRFNGLIDVLTQNQFKMIRKTVIIHIDPTLSKGKTVAGKRILSIREMLTNKAKVDHLIQLCKKTYTETHTDNPVAELPKESWRQAVMDGLLEDYSYVMVNDLEITAFSLMYEIDEKAWELGWIGVDNISQLSDLDKLIQKQLEDAAALGSSFIEKEVDSTCPYSLHICKFVKYKVAETLYAYMK